MIKKHIFGFDIPMGDIKFVKVLKPCNNLHKKMMSFILVFAEYLSVYILASIT